MAEFVLHAVEGKFHTGDVANSCAPPRATMTATKESRRCRHERRRFSRASQAPPPHIFASAGVIEAPLRTPPLLPRRQRALPEEACRDD